MPSDGGFLSVIRGSIGVGLITITDISLYDLDKRRANRS